MQICVEYFRKSEPKKVVKIQVCLPFKGRVHCLKQLLHSTPYGRAVCVF